MTDGPIDENGPSRFPVGLKSEPLIDRNIGESEVGDYLKNSIVAGVCGGLITKTAAFVATV